MDRVVDFYDNLSCFAIRLQIVNFRIGLTAQCLTSKKKMNNPNDMTKENSIFIGEGVVFKGSIKAPNQAVISGKFDGELDARDVLIGVSGVVTGKTTAQFVDVKGELNETVTSRELLIVRGTGRVSGSVTYGEIEIERGGQVKGDMIQR